MTMIMIWLWKWDSSLSLPEEVAGDKGWSLSIVAPPPTNKTAPTTNDYYYHYYHYYYYHYHYHYYCCVTHQTKQRQHQMIIIIITIIIVTIIIIIIVAPTKQNSANIKWLLFAANDERTIVMFMMQSSRSYLFSWLSGDMWKTCFQLTRKVWGWFRYHYLPIRALFQDSFKTMSSSTI